MMESHDDPSMMYNSTTNSTNTVNEILQDLHTANNKLDTLSAQMQSVAETTANTQSNTSALSRVSLYNEFNPHIIVTKLKIHNRLARSSLATILAKQNVMDRTVCSPRNTSAHCWSAMNSP